MEAGKFIKTYPQPSWRKRQAYDTVKAAKSELCLTRYPGLIYLQTFLERNLADWSFPFFCFHFLDTPWLPPLPASTWTLSS